MRVGCYVDGFNLYHALDDFGEPRNKWLNLRALAESYLRDGATIERVVFCTALNSSHRSAEAQARHSRYVRALAGCGVDTVKGSFAEYESLCYHSGQKPQKEVEKQSDVNIALSAYHDVSSGVVDEVWLVTADTDQVATLKFITSHHPAIRTRILFPPGRPSSRALKDHSTERPIRIDGYSLAPFRMAAVVNSPTGAIQRPVEYS